MYSLLNESSSMITAAVGLALDESELSLQKLQGSVDKANGAIQDLKDVQSVLDIGATAVSLAGAIVSRNAGAIANSIAAVYAAVKASQA